MSNEPIKHPGINGDSAFEHQDLSAKGIIYFMIGLAVAVVLIYFIAFGMYHFLDSLSKENQAPISPMVAPEADTRAATHAETQAFPEPRLEENERTQLRQFIANQDRTLATYNWIDKDKGIVQIPIDRAMDLIVQRGLPVRPPAQSQAGEQPRKDVSSAQ